jgi:hypothetical protein
MLDTLPVELGHHILDLACSDGGTTACALRLVSRSLSALALDHRFQSVMVVGQDQCDRLLLACEESCHPIRFECLFFSDGPLDAARKRLVTTMQVGITHDGTVDQDAWREVLRAQRLMKGLRRLLEEFAAPHVRSFHLVLYHPATTLARFAVGMGMAAMLSAPYPRLREFTFRIETVFPSSLATDICMQMPQLQVLRISQPSPTRSIFELAKAFAAASSFPLILELRDVYPDVEMPSVVRCLLGQSIPASAWPRRDANGQIPDPLPALERPYHHITVWPIWPPDWPLVTFMQSSAQCMIMSSQAKDTSFEEWKYNFRGSVGKSERSSQTEMQAIERRHEDSRGLGSTIKQLYGLK